MQLKIANQKDHQAINIPKEKFHLKFNFARKKLRYSFVLDL